MADGIFNVAKGRDVAYAERVINNDPANSAFVVCLGFGSITDAVLEDLDTFQAIKDDANFTEATFTNYAKKEVTNPTIVVNDTDNRGEVDMPDQTWANAGGATNNTLTRLIVCYDSDTGSGDDSDLIPLYYFDFDETTTGNDLQAQVDVGGLARTT